MAANPALTNTVRILVVDDEPDLRTLYELTLLRAGYRVETAESCSQALEHLDKQQFDIVITDMRLPDGLGMDVIRHLKTQQRPERCIVITAYGSADNAVQALKAGAFDYLTKPVDLQHFRAAIASAVPDTLCPSDKLPNSDPSLTTGAPLRTPKSEAALQRLVGESASMRLVKDRIVKVARSMAPVLVTGESGTGKELVANAIHANSHRAGRPLLAVNCSAIPESLLEAEFFGTKKGAYTGATQDRDGFFRAAGGGTLFLDEIGDLPLAMQSKLLRAIQERCVRPVGSTQEEQVDVRIISATHKDLASEVRAGRFRQDLYYRLNVIEIGLPPLRERREDLPALCQALLLRIAKESDMAVPVLSPSVLNQLALAPLPGNVRELENLLHRAVALGDENNLQIELPGRVTTTLPTGAGTTGVSAAEPVAIPNDLQSHLDRQERDILIQALRESGFNRTAAATRLGISLRQMRYRITRLRIDTPDSNEPQDEAV
jgi:two-component system, NtrC family, response regulator PilR